MLTFSQSHLRWHMIILSIIARHRAQSVADSSSRKIREKDATYSRKKRFEHLEDAQNSQINAACCAAMAAGAQWHSILQFSACHAGSRLQPSLSEPKTNAWAVRERG
jgi:hypothetical protein